MKYYLAIDIGASSGRHIIGYKDNGILKTEEVYRFPNSFEIVDGSLTWNIDKLFKEVKEGIKKALSIYKNIESMSIDTWGVDYVLMNNDKEIRPCYAYRDSRTKEVIDKVHSIIPFDKLYSITGCQFQEFNTIYQLYSDKEKGRLDKATDFLHIPEYLMYKLTGVKMHEYTNASTTSLLDGKTNYYSDEIIQKLGFNKALFKELYKPGKMVGDFTREVQEEVCGNITVVLCSTHDTASAVEGIPFSEKAPYISSGTWSLLGIKTNSVITSDKAREANYSNEYGKDYIRFQKNIMGLWIAQCLNKELNVDFNKMVELSYESNYNEIFDVNDNRFLSTLNMKDEIINYFINKNIAIPNNDSDLFRCVYRSLAYSYKQALEELKDITGLTFNKLYIVGGGAKNKFLNEVTEEFTNLTIIALPIEATSIGNLKDQMEIE